MFAYDFIRYAFAASGMVAIIAGLVGYFLVLRGQIFAGHALSHVAFTGAAGSTLVALPPMMGAVLVSLVAAIMMGWLEEKMSGRDVAIGMVLSIALGLGIWALHFSVRTAPMALLFGQLLGVTPQLLNALLLLSIVSVLALAFLTHHRR